MEGLTPYITILKNLGYQARKLTSTGLSLTKLFAEEASRLNRRDEASRLRALYLSFRQQLDWAKRSEDTAKYGYSQANLIVSLGGLAVSSIIKMVSENKQLSTFSDHLFASLTSKEHPFGMVLVCVGPKGLPDDVGVVSVSRLARESNREESEVIKELKERGHLLLSEKVFSLLFDKLINDVQEGRLHLPISTEKLAEPKNLSCLKLEAKKLG